MQVMSVGEFKPRFSDVLEDVRNGEDIVISYGRKKERVAVLIPYKNYDKHLAQTSSNENDVATSHALDAYIGTWVEDPEADTALQEFDQIDDELWQ